ncbi:DUF6701 domain-containing protein [Janthinobacterium sp. RB2R34]|uniref:DUF6701 domain-containing protein n=1 Tax=Janthinobacterium sp. RB2R34 TaxID=3424193 RepID=UPI003F23137D
MRLPTIVRIPPALVGLLFLLSTSLLQAATLNFNGSAVTGCSNSGAVYTCASLQMGSTDVAVIASGARVTVNRDVTIEYNQGLTMSGTAMLTVRGNLDVSNTYPPNLNISGGTLVSTAGFFAGAQGNQVIVADITAESMRLGGSPSQAWASPVQIRGNLTATNDISIASRSNITGSISARNVVTDSSVVINGDVDVSSNLILASASTLNGNVEGGSVTLKASETTITGNALVDFLTLEWHGRVQQTITCKSPLSWIIPCICVANGSGYLFGSNSPQCGARPPSGPHHFQIAHPAEALSCAPEKVTVTACSNADCSSAYTSGAQVVVAPGAVQASTGSSGSADLYVSNTAGGTSTLSLTSTPGASNALVCKNSSTGSVSNCQIQFKPSGLQVSGNPRYAEDSAAITISSLQASPSNPSACVPLFKNQVKTIKLKCNYADPGTGTLPARIQNTAGAYVALAGNATSACTTAGADVALQFDANGEARPLMLYADVGLLGLNATYSSPGGSDSGLVMSGSGSVIVAPKAFLFSAIAPTQRAGLPALPAASATSITVSAVNASNVVTRNFGRESKEQKVLLGRTLVEPIFSGSANPAASGSVSFLSSNSGPSNGVATASSMIWPEVGQIKFTATLQTGYMDSALQSTGSSAPVTFVPHHFVTELVDAASNQPPFPYTCVAPLVCPSTRAVYSRQPFPLRVTARKADDTTTVNFDARYAAINATQVALRGYDAATGLVDSPPATPAGSSLTDGPATPAAVTGIGLANFTSGVGTRNLAYSFPGAFSLTPGGTALAPPTDLLLRASYSYAGSVLVTSLPAELGKEAQVTVLTGRIFVPNSFGAYQLPARLSLQSQYWTSAGWRVNLGDRASSFSRAQVMLANCLKSLVCSALQVNGQSFIFSGGELVGSGRLVLQAPGAAGSVDVSVTGLPYLPSTVGRVVFGISRSGPVLYMREMY